MLKLIHLENMDLTWKSIIFDLPRGVLSFAVRSSIDYLPTFSNLRTWGKRSQTKCKLCGNYETLLHVLNNCTVSLNQGRYTWRHNSILKHMLTALKGFIEPTNNDLSLFSDIGGYTTTGGTLPVDVIVSKLKPDMVFYNKKDNTIHLVELTVPFEKNIQKAHDRKAQKYRDLVSDILDNGFTCDLTCFEIGSRGLITPENIRNIDKIFSFVNTKPSKSFRKELSKVALLTSYTIWNARQEPAWGSENQPLLSAWFSFILALPSAFAGFISEFLCLSPAVVLYVFVCVQPCVEASPWLSSRPGLKCTSFCHAFCSCCMQCLNKGCYNTCIQLSHYCKRIVHYRIT